MGNGRRMKIAYRCLACSRTTTRGARDYEEWAPFARLVALCPQCNGTPEGNQAAREWLEANPQT